MIAPDVLGRTSLDSRSRRASWDWSHHIQDTATFVSFIVYGSDGIDPFSPYIGSYCWDCRQLTSDTSSRRSWRNAIGVRERTRFCGIGAIVLIRPGSYRSSCTARMESTHSRHLLALIVVSWLAILRPDALGRTSLESGSGRGFVGFVPSY